MNNNDFSEVLRDFINTLNLPLDCKLDYLSEGEDLVLYPLPGGKILTEYMNGKQDISLVFEVAIKTTNHQKQALSCGPSIMLSLILIWNYLAKTIHINSEALKYRSHS